MTVEVTHVQDMQVEDEYYYHDEKIMKFSEILEVYKTKIVKKEDKEIQDKERK